MKVKFRVICCAFFSYVLLSTTAFACAAPDSVMSYRPSKKPVRVKMRETSEGLMPARLPPFDVSLKDVRRSPGRDAMPCGQYGSITVQIDWPASSAYRLDEVGFYFRVVDAANTADIFETGPVVGKITGNSMRLFFVFDDEEPKERKPWNLTVEAFAVNAMMEIGPVTKFQLKSVD
ncbi:hypothetical protein [Pseudoduganella violaceinigra]|uniref:hypothetical protein n=1 Tax=Pseudoduganella violaceinigra TaxID=246602 RepID=UPI0012B5C5CC|nr:hypothetical protein [Pseudoduganella violaceinigra]